MKITKLRDSSFPFDQDVNFLRAIASDKSLSKIIPDLHLLFRDSKPAALIFIPTGLKNLKDFSFEVQNDVEVATAAANYNANSARNKLNLPN